MYQSIAATSTTLQELLLDFMEADSGPSGLASFFGSVGTVSLSTPQAMMRAGRHGLSVWLYRIEQDPLPRLGQPTAGGVEMPPPPLPLRLHYLLTPLADGNSDIEQRILGRAMQFFHSHPIIAGSMLRAEFAETDAQLQARLEPFNLDEVTRVWGALGGSYQLCVSCEISTARIDVDTIATPT